MSTIISFPSVLKSRLQEIAAERDYRHVSAVLSRGEPEQLVLESQAEAQSLVNIARIEMLDAALRYPLWNDDLPDHDPEHENAFQDVQMGIFEKTVMYVGQSYKIVSTV